MRLSDNNRGFTLVELVIAMAIFSLAVFAAVGLFVSIVRGERRNQDIRYVQQNSRYIVESVSRDIRVAQTVNVEAGNESIVVSNERQLGSRIRYALDGDDITREICSGTSSTACTGTGVPINPDGIEVESFSVEQTRSESDLIYYWISIVTKRVGYDDDDPDQYTYRLETTVTNRERE